MKKSVIITLFIAGSLLTSCMKENDDIKKLFEKLPETKQELTHLIHSLD